MSNLRSNLWWGVFFGILLAGVFYWLSQVSFVAFHLAVGLATVTLGLGVAMVSINSQRWLTNHFFLSLSIGVIFVAVVDFTQTVLFAAPGLIASNFLIDHVYQLWLLSSLIQCFSFALALTYINRRLNHLYAWVITMLAITVGGLYLVVNNLVDLQQNLMTVGVGVLISYFVTLVLIACVVRVIMLKQRFHRTTWWFLLFALVLLLMSQMISNISFMDYVLVDSFADIARFLAYFCLYHGVVVVAINNPETFVFSETNKKQAELEKTVEEMKIFRLAMENASDQIIITDVNGKITFANHAVEVITGYSVAEVLGKSPAIWGKRMPQEYYQKLWKTIKTDKLPFHGEITNRRKNGEEYSAEIHITPIINNQGELINFLGLEQDISRQRTIDKMKSEFITVASHQLRTPLSASKWFLEMLTAKDFGEYNDKQAEALKNLTSSNERMIQIVNGLLNVSRIESGRLNVVPESMDMGKTISDVVLEFDQQIKANGLEVVKTIDTNSQLQADRKLTVEILKILIGNAINYSPTGGVLTVATERSPERLIVKVSDTGMGIPPSEQPQVFSRFFRASNAIRSVTEGSGLGLYFAKELVTAMGGEMGFESHENKGSTFWFKLPLNMGPKAGFVSLDT